MRAAEHLGVHQAAHLWVSGDEPRFVADGGEDSVDRASGLQGPKFERGLKRMCLVEWQLH